MTVADIQIYEDIGEYFDGMTPSRFGEMLAKVPSSDPLNIYVNSLGGSVADGITMFNQIRRFATQQRAFNKDYVVTGIVDGYAFSAASVLLMACDKIVMNRGSMQMVHRVWTLGMGNARELRKIADRLDQSDANLVQIYARRTGKSEADIFDLLDAETYMNAEEAVKAGFADLVDETSEADMNRFPEATAAFKAFKPNNYIEFMRDRARKVAERNGTTLAAAARRLALLELETAA